MSAQNRAVNGRLELWLPLPLPGGWVCGEPDDTRPDGVCGMPIESEPCTDHHPDPDPDAPDGTDQRALAPAAVAPTEPASDLHRGLDLGAAVEAALTAIHRVDCLDGDDCLATPMMAGRYGRMTEAAIQAAVPHMLRAVADLLDAGSGEEYDYGPLASPRLRALAEEIAGGGK